MLDYFEVVETVFQVNFTDAFDFSVVVRNTVAIVVKDSQPKPQTVELIHLRDCAHFFLFFRFASVRLSLGSCF